MTAETEKIENSHNRKFDEIAEKIQSMEKSMSKVPKLDEKSKSSKNFVLKHIIKDVADFKEGNWIKCEREQHFNAKWFLQIMRNESHLGIHVFCEPIVPNKDEWSIETKLEFKMIVNDDNSVIKTFKCCFDDDEGWGYDNFVKWVDINNYLVDNKLTIEVKVEIRKMAGFGKEILMKFDESVADLSDIVLIVNDRKFYLSKYFLSLQSSHFKTLFSGKFNESQKNKLELKDIDPDDFQNFLELIHGESSNDDDTVEGVLHLSEMFHAPTAIRRCEEFLLEKSKKKSEKKFKLALRYGLENLKTKCLSEITTISDIQSIVSSDPKEMDVQTAMILLQKCLSFSNK
ncbi:hypothetical protein B9Z55_007768 [Caenorhabditis nigoni]|nr:hypothetical protein B9Z55_007768 [Caenorhabditis nigoni]